MISQNLVEVTGYEQVKDEQRLDTSKLVTQLTLEYESLTQVEKIDNEKIESLFKLLYEKWGQNVKNPSDAGEVLHHFKQEFKSLFISIFTKIVAETGDQGNFIVIDQAKSLITSNPQFAFKGDLSRATYSTRGKSIYIPEGELSKLTDFGFFIAELTTKGFVTGANLIHHEYIHSLQDVNDGVLKSILKSLGVGLNRDLKEVQAMIGSDRKGRGKSIDVKYVKQQLKSDYPDQFGSEAAQLRIETSWKLIYELYALGLTDNEIGDMVGRSVWSKESQTFTVLASKVAQLCQEKHISEQELANLVTVDQLRTKIRIEQSRIIAKYYVEAALKGTAL